MSEVIRYLASHTPYEGLDLNGQCARHDGDYFVSAADFDRVTAERDAALVDRDYCKRVAEHNKEIGEQLQQRLTAAEADCVKGGEHYLRKIAECANLELRVGHLEGLLNLAQGHIGDASLSREIEAALKPAEGGGDEWKSWSVGNTVRYQGSGQDGEDCYCRMRKGSDYLIHEAPDDHESMVVLDDDGDELCALVGEFKWIKP